MSDYQATAEGVLRGVGGEQNVGALVHCATRLRFSLRDESLFDPDAIRTVPGVITTARNGDEFQVVIGNEVPEVFAAVGTLLGGSTDAQSPRPAAAKRGNPPARFVAMISAIFSPLLWALASVGLFKAFIASATTFGWLAADSSTSSILNALSDGFIYFLPMALAISAAKYFGAQQFTSLAIAGAMLYPAIADLNGVEGLTFFGVPATIVGYAYGVVPIIVAVWLQSHMERVLYARIPAMVRRFTTPIIVLAVLVPFVFLAIGPVAAFLTGGVANGISWIFQTVPWLGGAVMGGLWQVLIIFGVHSGFTPFFVAEYQQYGYGLLLAPLWAAVLAQAGAAIGVWVRTKSAARRALAGSATVSVLLAGVSEPAVYGVNLPLRRPFAFAILGGAVGGGIISGAGVAINAAIVFPSALSIPALTGNGNFAFAIIGIVVAMLIAFLGTVVFGFKELEEPTAATVAAAPIEAVDLEVRSPLTGTVVPLDRVGDPAFASGGLGHGAAIVPSEGRLVAPFDAEVVVVFPTAHAIGLRHASGAQLLIHVGLDTVRLDGEHFTAHVAQGQQVRAGDLLVEFDREAVIAAGYDLTTPIVVTDSAAYPLIGALAQGPITAGERLYVAAAADAEPVAD